MAAVICPNCNAMVKRSVTMTGNGAVKCPKCRETVVWYYDKKTGRLDVGLR